MYIPFNKPFISGKELYYISQSVNLGKIAGDGEFGRICEQTLEKMLGYSGKVLLTNSCTAALEIAAMLLGIGEGDEVIMPSYTFVSTANAFCVRGAKPVFVDVDPKNLNIDIDQVERAISEKTKAIVPVHYAGISCDMDMLMHISRKHGIPVVEDAAQAINSSYKGKPLGSFGALATFSFHETKNINCGEGGALVVNDPTLVGRAEIIREKGTNRNQFFRGEVDKYTWVDRGSSYVLSDILSAYLAAQLEHLEDTHQRRWEVYEKYREGLSDLADKGLFRLPMTPEYNQGNAHLFYLMLPDLSTRTRLMNFLNEAGVNTVFHYVPLHTSPVGRQYGYTEGSLPVTEDVSDRLLRLPMFYSLTDEEVGTVIDCIHRFYE